MNRGNFSYEINVTRLCNLRCTYCFEGDSCDRTETIRDHIEAVKLNIHSLLNDEWFRVNFESIHITFWGGEPTLEPDIMKSVVDEFKDDSRVTFHVYTNGIIIDSIISIFEPIKDKLSIQISYDGNPIHDINRIDRLGNGSAELIKRNVDILVGREFNVSLKSTIRPDDLKYLSDAWDDICSISSKYGNKMVYAPTIDYSNKYDNSYINDLKKCLLEICKKEVKYYKEHGKYLLVWFDRGIDYCGFFKSGMFVDVDGSIKYCHGCGYYNNEELTFSSVYDKDLIEKLKYNWNTFDAYKYDDTCDRCIAKVCYSCNVAKYINSSKEGFIDRWYDFSCQPVLCEYFRLITKFKVALDKAIKE